MTARLPSDVLDRSADESSRLLALTYLDEIELAVSRLTNPLDTEALHDFRVGLRRLRSCTRAYRTELKDSVSKPMRRRLKKLARATNAGRDAEVHLSWLQSQADRLGPEHTEGLAWLIGRLEGRQYETLAGVTLDVGRKFTKLAASYRPRLGTLRIEVRRGRGGERPSFRQVTGELICRQAAELGESLRAVRSVDQVEEIHQARIAAKRLRYLLEPLARRAAGTKRLTAQLRGLQDVLGQLHDLHVLAEEIASALEALSRSPTELPRRAEPGLCALEQLAKEQESAAFAGFQAHWGDQRGTRFFERADEFGRMLTSTAVSSAEDLSSLSPRQNPPSEPAHPALSAGEQRSRKNGAG